MEKKVKSQIEQEIDERIRQDFCSVFGVEESLVISTGKNEDTTD